MTTENNRNQTQSLSESVSRLMCLRGLYNFTSNWITTFLTELMYRLSMYDPPPSLWGTLTSSIFISSSFVTPTPSHFLSLTLTFSIIINKLCWTLNPKLNETGDIRWYKVCPKKKGRDLQSQERQWEVIRSWWRWWWHLENTGGRVTLVRLTQTLENWTLFFTHVPSPRSSPRVFGKSSWPLIICLLHWSMYSSTVRVMSDSKHSTTPHPASVRWVYYQVKIRVIVVIRKDISRFLKTG